MMTLKHKPSKHWSKDSNKNIYVVIYGPWTLSHPTHYNNQKFQNIINMLTFIHSEDC